MSNKNVETSAILKTLSEVEELIKSSGYKLKKDDSEDDKEMEEAGLDAPVHEGEEGDAESPDSLAQAGADVEPEPEMGNESSEEAPEMEEAPAEEGDHDDAEEIMAELQALPSEELQGLIEMLQHELSSRDEGSEEEAPEMEEEPSDFSMEKSKEGVDWHNEGKGGLPTKDEWRRMQAAKKKDQKSQTRSGKPLDDSRSPKPDADNAEMQKMYSEMKKSLDALAKENASLKKSVAKLESARKSTPVTKPVASNKKTVEVMEKSQKEPEVLSKSEVVDFLMNERKGGNTKVNSDLVWAATRLDNQNDIKEFYKKASIAGINIPSKK